MEEEEGTWKDEEKEGEREAERRKTRGAGGMWQFKEKESVRSSHAVVLQLHLVL